MSIHPRTSHLPYAALLFALTSNAALAQPPTTPTRDIYSHAAEPIGTVSQSYDGALAPEIAVNTFRNIDRLFPTRLVPRSSSPLPLPLAAVPLVKVSVNYGGRRFDLEQILELNRVSGLLVIKDGHIKMERYRYGNDARTRWMSMSVAKSITSTLIGSALRQGYIGALSDPVTQYVPSLQGSAYDGVSVRDVLMMCSGVRWNETYTNPASDRRRLLTAQIAQTPGALMAVMKSLPRDAPPGTVNNYSTGETQVAAEVLRSAVKQPLATYLAERIWSRVGMEADANWWLASPDGIEIGGSGISATLRDYSRFGLFVLNGGVAGGEAIVPDGWFDEATTPKVLPHGEKLDYGYLWWPGPTTEGRPDRAFTAAGLHGQYLYVNPARKVVIVMWSAQPMPADGAVVDEWAFLEAIVNSLN